MSPINRNKWLLALLLVSFLLSTRWLNKPFIGHHDWDSVLVSIQVLNYHELGYFKHYGMQIRTQLHMHPTDDLTIYRSTAPTFAIALALWAEATSFNELTLRLFNIFINLVAISVFYQLAWQLFRKRRIVRFATAIYATLPFVIYFPAVVNWEVGIHLIMLLTVLCYLRWWRYQNPIMLGYLAFLAILGIWYFFTMPWLLLTLFGHSLLFGDRRHQVTTFSVGLIGALALVVWGFYTTEGFDPHVIQEIQDHLAYRSSDAANTPTDESTATWGNYLTRYASRLLYALSPFTLFFALWGARRAFSKQNPERPTLGIIAAMAITIVCNNLMWRNASFLHDYYMYGLVAPAALWAGYGLDYIWGNNRSWMARNRLQRFASAFIIGHILFALTMTNFFANFGNTPIVWLSDGIRTHTAIGETAATDLSYLGPHIEFYAERNINYDVAPEQDRLREAFETNRIALYVLCDEAQLSAMNIFQVEPLEACYLVRP